MRARAAVLGLTFVVWYPSAARPAWMMLLPHPTCRQRPSLGRCCWKRDFSAGYVKNQSKVVDFSA